VIVIVFGVSGAGKTTIGKLLAQELDWRFHEAGNGIETHEPWLASLRIPHQGEFPKGIYPELFTCVHIVP